MSVKFGLFADLHSTLPGAAERGYSIRSFADMEKGLKRFADVGADFAVSLGDNLQPAEDRSRQYTQLGDMVQTWRGSGIPVYLSPGNHEFQQLTESDVCEILQTKLLYQYFDIEDKRFIILDTAWMPDGAHYDAGNFDWRFSIVPSTEIKWLAGALSAKKRTYIFTHCNLWIDQDYEPYADCFMIRNHREIREMLERSECVEAVFQGHHHTYHFANINGIPYINIPSPERSPAYSDENFPIVEIAEDGFLYNGRRLTDNS